MNWMWKWLMLGFALALGGCIGDPTCEDLATCPLAQAITPPINESESGVPDAGPALPAEDCTNDNDDDSDGKTDCADSDCQTNPGCEAQLPLNFDGFAVISILSTDDPTQTCADGSEAVILYQNPNEQICDACMCDASNVSCSGPNIALDVRNDACAELEFIFYPGVDECVSIYFPDFGIFDPLQSAAISGEAYVKGGECNAKGGAPITTSAMKTKVAACALTDPSQVVVSDEEHLCMYAEGHLPVCPAGWSAVATNAFTGYIDERQGCAPCGCIAGCSGGEYEVFAQSGCSGDGVIISPGGVCAAITPTSDFSIMGKAPTGTCTLSGGEPIGKVIPTGEKTLCCKS